MQSTLAVVEEVSALYRVNKHRRTASIKRAACAQNHLGSQCKGIYLYFAKDRHFQAGMHSFKHTSTKNAMHRGTSIKVIVNCRCLVNSPLVVYYFGHRSVRQRALIPLYPPGCVINSWEFSFDPCLPRQDFQCRQYINSCVTTRDTCEAKP